MRVHRLAIALALAHTLVLAVFTMPAEWVPLRLRYWSQAYAGSIFHQDWRLFAPDPPGCGCSIQYRREGEREWHRLEDLHTGFVWQRMAANACRFAEMADAKADVWPEALTGSFVQMIGMKPGERVEIWIPHEFLSTHYVIERSR